MGEVRHTALSVLGTLGQLQVNKTCRGHATGAKLATGEPELFVCDQKEAEEASTASLIKKSASTSSLPSISTRSTGSDAEIDLEAEVEDKDPSPSYNSYRSDSRRLTPAPPSNTEAEREPNRSRLAAFLFDSVDTDTDDDLFLPATTIDINYRSATTSTATFASDPVEGAVKMVPRHVPSRMLWEVE